MTKTQLKQLMCLLSPLENEILRLRYGFDGKRGRRVSDLTHIFTLSREEIQETELRAQNKLRKLIDELKAHRGMADREPGSQLVLWQGDS